MSTDLRDIPSPPRGIDQGLRKTIMSLIGHVQELRGFRGDGSGAVGTGGGGGGTTVIIPGAPSPPAAPPPYVPDLTPPPTPTGVSATAGPDFVFISTDPPTFTEGHGYARTLVYGAKWAWPAVVGDPDPPLPVFADAVLVHEYVGQVGSFASDFNTRWRIWVKWRSVDGVLSTNPEGGTNGRLAITGQDVSSLLDALAGEITTSQLNATLNSRIDLVDGSGAGSVNARIATETNGRVAAIATEASTRSTVDGYLGAQWTLRLDLNGRVVGFGISATSAPGAGPTSDFLIVADRFSVVPPFGTPGVGNIVPFTVQTTAITTAAGEVLPAGVYMNAAFIRNLEAALGRFQNAIITNAMIVNLSASKILAGSLGVGEYIQSTGFSPGNPGFRISGDGNVEVRSAGNTRVFNLGASGSQPVLQIGGAIQILANGTASYAGALSAATGTFAGDISAASGIFRGAILGGSFTGFAWPAAGGTGFYLGPEGLLLGNFNNGKYLQVTADGNVIAPGFSIVNGNAGFSGQLAAASGTFAGSLTASAVDAVDTINLRGNSVTVPSSVTASNTVGFLPSTEVGMLSAPAIDPGNGAVVLIFTADWVAGWDSGGENGGGAFAPTFVFRRNGVFVTSYTPQIGFGGTRSCTALSIIDVPGAGSQTYTVHGIDNVTGTVQSRSTIGRRNLTVLGAKR